ncbi:MAG TPA: 23S rRNA (guanosine(2251)-2'-O)-methyltransferase RlmB [Sediminibacterium sp.]|uniref:23S rRNA (guanosine(2251)-2'-O)-methyltransferase RlmB n=1 Tax=Sediminibacterium sp. TaxID=1917865 RepID=UPI0008B3C446|nr:23S rRNA (guanosine(2251)-2'-O)-methyltransferase RlmB [Sediminibacterium sp.]MBT9485271.1 23S rRNA (guanosine(2251)-2'-O)-methyltransferase RlmB [Sediminibacterium sp.]OHC84083.1 MAG: 23S rRNA (guanosine(2251)-2'-O)-methyltransferase RlmB [Sphingobacteriia bacterium RIFOXYC2_FULL_35_18]OHC87870.1 MAG: 23S rRNA (guanosine(2251)-2'-O)-methyltransferase RlmB [Sphingobacteriia bacterium RIFOXYD2_FULL_35_12]HLD52128.1 23S rRNA (guanosine(2251)-2'-O)-methyltransferase RlmB [Sediminibacterium sp.]
MALKKTSLIIGRQPLVEALQSGKAIDKILLQKNASGEVVHQIRTLSREHNIPIQLVPIEKLNGLTKANHQGVIAIVALVQYLDLQQVIDHVVSEGTVPLFLMLDGVTDVRNIGAIARTAVCCGAQAIIIPDKGVGALNEEAMKSSAGALEKIHICRVGSLLKAVDDLHLNGIAVYTSEMRAEKNVYDLDYTIPCCVIMGDEGRGVQPYLAKAADAFFKIPMAAKFDSLNVSVATGMILYEGMKQRMGVKSVSN